MAIYTLTSGSPETIELNYIQGVVQALVDGNSTFDGATVRLAVSIGGSEFVLATVDDFLISQEDSLRFELNNGAKYKFVLDGPYTAPNVTIYVEVDPYE